MRIGIRGLKIDLIIQRIIGITYLGIGIVGFMVHGLLMIALLIQILIGFWQVMSALVFTLVNKSAKRAIYLASVVFYFILMGVGVYLLEIRILDEGVLLFVTGLVIIPIALGIWYYSITQKEYDFLIKHPVKDDTFKHEMEGILDSDELGLQ